MFLTTQINDFSSSFSKTFYILTNISGRLVPFEGDIVDFLKNHCIWFKIGPLQMQTEWPKSLLSTFRLTPTPFYNLLSKISFPLDILLSSMKLCIPNPQPSHSKCSFCGFHRTNDTRCGFGMQRLLINVVLFQLLACKI